MRKNKFGAIAVQDAVQQLTQFVIAVHQWSDGTADPTPATVMTTQEEFK